MGYRKSQQHDNSDQQNRVMKTEAVSEEEQMKLLVLESEEEKEAEVAEVAKEGAHHSYRADIDGLRTVAVVAVVVFHYFPTHLQGGFVGVDVFFVISGYLISGHLDKQCASGTFTYGQFYSKRIRRILPAFLVVVVCTQITGLVALDATPLKRMASTAAWGCAFSANIGLLLAELDAQQPGATSESDAAQHRRLQGGYWDSQISDSVDDTNPSQQGNPLLMLWSLGVEEQFYLVWPFVIGLMVTVKNDAFSLAMFAVIILGSLVLCIWVSVEYADDSFAYYLPLTRVWQMAIGALLAWLMQHHITPQGSLPSRVLQECCSICGCGLIFISIVMISKEFYFPGYIATVPTVGAALVIASGPEATLNKYFLGNYFSAFVGRISYPLYLWHWPLLVYATIYFTESTCMADECQLPWGMKLAAIGLSIFLSLLTLYFVERPIRHHVWKYTPHALSACCFCVFIAAVVLILSTDSEVCEFAPCEQALQNDPPARAPLQECSNSWQCYRSLRRGKASCPQAPPLYNPTSALNRSGPERILEQCKLNVNFAAIDERVLMPDSLQVQTINGNRPNTVFVLGDSIVVNWHTRYRYLAKHYGERMPTVEFFCKWGMTPILGPPDLCNSYGCAQPRFSPNHYMRQAIAKIDATTNVTGIVIGAWWERHLTRLRTGNTTHWTKVPWPCSKDESESGKWSAHVDHFLQRFTSQIRTWVARGIKVYVIGAWPKYRENWHQDGWACQSQASNYTWEDYGTLCAKCACGPKEMKLGVGLEQDLTPYVSPFNATIWHELIGFVADPLLNASAAAGATLLDATKTMCLDDMCPRIDPAGYAAYFDMLHVSSWFAEVYGGFLDETVGVTDAPQPRQYCT